MEVKLVFPTCWNGVDLTSEDMTSHVSYDVEEGRFDADCPESHPVKIPEVHFYFRIKKYEGGEYVFSDGTSTYHADYLSGWDADELQTILDGRSNPSDAASPDQFCESHLTFRSTKHSSVQVQDDSILSGLQALQKTANPDMQKTVSTEAVNNIASLPRGSCTGIVVPAGEGGADEGSADEGGTKEMDEVNKGGSGAISNGVSTGSLAFLLGFTPFLLEL